MWLHAKDKAGVTMACPPVSTVGMLLRETLHITTQLA